MKKTTLNLKIQDCSHSQLQILFFTAKEFRVIVAKNDPKYMLNAAHNFKLTIY